MTDKITVLVLGSTGMLGAKIVKALLDKGEAEVRAMIRPNSYDKTRQDGFDMAVLTWVIFLKFLTGSRFFV
ncbi:NAD-dependent epimerase/dehydratase family protein [Waterburya agarophytonicola K14]|uniref:NAD-dependent epimerase/dehydratase family protein n=1 Tax=Waterburya agarophytonicola KI4 TaxID=2874699 RepID=A0A964BLC3_9CYAN|nr:NAD-dependent epimerase/dehydratase family protein [Waterburya agarophytonicola]MCC0175504.1 NAD-dependent epimerase/dehydratase family protein [Waterburya agarophytonicola KI4]